MAGEGLCLFFFLCDGRNVWHFKFTYKRPSVNATHFYYYNPVNSRNKHVSQLHPPRRWGNTALSHLSIGEVVLIQIYLRIKNRRKGENITKMSHNGSLQQHVRLRKNLCMEDGALRRFMAHLYHGLFCFILFAYANIWFVFSINWGSHFSFLLTFLGFHPAPALQPPHKPQAKMAPQFAVPKAVTPSPAFPSPHVS